MLLLHNFVTAREYWRCVGGFSSRLRNVVCRSAEYCKCLKLIRVRVKNMVSHSWVASRLDYHSEKFTSAKICILTMASFYADIVGSTF